MSNISQWSNSAIGNNSASPNGFPEGMPPSGVNDAAREIMAAVRRQEEAAEWFDWGYTPTYATTTTFTLAGDRTTLFHVGRRLKLGDGSTLYGIISDTTYSASTRISLNLDSGGLTSSLSSVSVGILSLLNDALPRGRFAELSATNTFTAPINFGAGTSFSATTSFGSAVKFNGVADFSATASFGGMVNFGSGTSYSATATFNNIVRFNNPVNFSATASFGAKPTFGSGIFSTWTTISAGTTYQALTDLIICARAVAAPVATIIGYTDASTPPTTQVVGTSGDYTPSLTFPVKKGDYYHVAISGQSSYAIYVLQF